MSVTKWNWAWQPQLPQVSSAATAPSPRSRQPSLEPSTSRLSAGLNLADAPVPGACRLPEEGILSFVALVDLLLALQNVVLNELAETSDCSGQNSLKVACFSYSHSGFFTPLVFLLGKFLRIIIPSCSVIELGLGCQNYKTTESFGIFWSVS